MNIDFEFTDKHYSNECYSSSKSIQKGPNGKPIDGYTCNWRRGPMAAE